MVFDGVVVLDFDDDRGVEVVGVSGSQSAEYADVAFDVLQFVEVELACFDFLGVVRGEGGVVVFKEVEFVDEGGVFGGDQLVV